MPKHICMKNFLPRRTAPHPLQSEWQSLDVQRYPTARMEDIIFIFFSILPFKENETSTALAVNFVGDVDSSGCLFFFLTSFHVSTKIICHFLLFLCLFLEKKRMKVSLISHHCDKGLVDVHGQQC